MVSKASRKGPVRARGTVRAWSLLGHPRLVLISPFANGGGAEEHIFNTDDPAVESSLVNLLPDIS